MALVQKIQTFRTSLGRKPDQLAADLNTFFTSQGRFLIWDIDFSRIESTRAGDIIQFRLLYSELTGDSVGLEYEAVLYTDTASTIAQDQYNEAFRANLARVPFHYADLTDHEPRKGPQQNLLVIFAKTDQDPLNLLGHPTAVFVAEPLANIAASATGNCCIYDATGRVISDSFAVTNRGTAQWDLGERGLCVYDLVSGQLIGQPSCAGAAALTTTSPTTVTTNLPCVTYEVVSREPTR